MKENLVKIIVILLAFLIIILQSCSPTEPPDDNNGNIPDTTSQNLTFETFEFGEGFSSSYFRDVWIFTENNIWAVGYISPSDTIINGKHITNPNIIKWDGESWKIQPFSGTSSGIEGIWALDTSHIYFASGNIIKYQNNKYENIVVQGNWTQGQSIEKLWGSSENNIWGVGPFGTIVHYDGVSWTKIEFDRQWRFDDITGFTENGTAYAVGVNQGFTTVIVELKNQSGNIIYQSDEPSSYTISYFDNENLILSNNKIWLFNLNEKTTTVISDLKGGYFLPVKAFNKKNDIYYFGNLIGTGERLIHYNGIRFKDIPFSNRSGVLYGGAFAINNLAVLGGFSNNKAYLVKVRRL